MYRLNGNWRLYCTVLIGILMNYPAISLSKYELKADKKLLEKSRSIMINQVGTLERNNRNDGDVLKYLKLFNLSEGNPYCAAGQYYCFWKAVKELNLSKEYIPVPKSPMAIVYFNYAKQSGIKIKYAPNIDDLIIWRKPKTINGHIERVITVHKAGWVTTVGFNTSKIINGKRKEGVFYQRRNIYHPLGRLMIKGLIGFKKQLLINKE